MRSTINSTILACTLIGINSSMIPWRTLANTQSTEDDLTVHARRQHPLVPKAEERDMPPLKLNVD